MWLRGGQHEAEHVHLNGTEEPAMAVSFPDTTAFEEDKNNRNKATTKPRESSTMSTKEAFFLKDRNIKHTD